MRKFVAASFFAFGIVAQTSSHAASSNDVQEAIDLIVTFCVAGGESVTLVAKGEVEGGFALRRLGVGAEGEIEFTSEQSKGLVKGLQSEINSLAAEQQSEARRCMQPYIDRMLQFILGDPAAVAPTTQAIVRTKWFSSPRLSAKRNPTQVAGNFVTTCVRAPDGWLLKPETAHFDQYELRFSATGYNVRLPSRLMKSSSAVVCGDLQAVGSGTVLATLNVQGERREGLHFQ
ncbi:hypothetical protein [Pelagibius sp.]|uniref:hypothetical protein n=1 Tax=Pelagibius sp. TaxID=1931238 RepID=UPI003BAE80BF